MAIKIYNTLTRRIEDFTPIVPGKVSMYVCGATVQASPHIGHIRSAIAFDIIRRWLNYSGYQVTFIRNVTDIDDKILKIAEQENIPWRQLAYKNELEFKKVYDKLNVLPPDVEPRATGYIPQMVNYIKELIAKDMAYASGGDVYFSVDKLKDYGKLSGQKLAEMNQGESLGKHKRNELDFTLWKGAKSGEPAWDTPWGPGRPGWHLECTVMSTELLADTFDIHGGGRDLLFPHHENELAQALGDDKAFAKYWMHNGMINLGGEKMSKSIGNTVSIYDLLEEFTPEEIRYYFLTADYRTDMNFSVEALREASTAFRRLKSFIIRTIGSEQVNPAEVTLPELFIEKMNNDFSTSAALAVVHEIEKEGNKAVSGNQMEVAEIKAKQLAKIFQILGINISDKEVTKNSKEIIDYLMPFIVEKRNTYKQNKDWKESDKIRDDLTRLGVEISDTSQGTEWILKD